MKNILYHYVHCPFCVRVRMALGYLDVPYVSRVLSYDNEKIPIGLTGKKMLPIMESSNITLNESIDIIRNFDVHGKLFINVSNEKINEFEKICQSIGNTLHPLAMTAWLNTPEFNNDSKNYFRIKKEVKRGPFSKLIEKTPELSSLLEEFISKFNFPESFVLGDQLSILDIMVVSHFYGVYCLNDFYLDRQAHDYFQRVRDICKFNYHEDYDVNKIFIHWEA